MLKPPAGVLVPVAPARRYQFPPPVAVLLISTAAPFPLAVVSEPEAVSRLDGVVEPTPTKPEFVTDIRFLKLV